MKIQQEISGNISYLAPKEAIEKQKSFKTNNEEETQEQKQKSNLAPSIPSVIDSD